GQGRRGTLGLGDRIHQRDFGHIGGGSPAIAQGIGADEVTVERGWSAVLLHQLHTGQHPRTRGPATTQEGRATTHGCLSLGCCLNLLRPYVQPGPSAASRVTNRGRWRT